MSVYVMSDLHGNYDAFMAMLDKIEFNENDYLYIIGDVIDRNLDSFKLLQYVMNMKNAELLMGNHEDMMISYYREYSLHSLMIWLDNGGQVTKNHVDELPEEERQKLLSYLFNLPILAEIDVCGKIYVLGHGCPFAENDSDILWDRRYPNFELPENADPNVTYICGHTPTINFKEFDGSWEMIKSDNGKMYYIDCGAAFPKIRGARLCCIRLDDEQVFYVPANQHNGGE